MKFSLALPREAMSIPVIRRVLGDALRGLGVSEDCVSDILLATSEACTNVVKHAWQAARYEVLASIDEGKCVLKVVEMGPEPNGPIDQHDQNDLTDLTDLNGVAGPNGLSWSPRWFVEQRPASRRGRPAPGKADEAESGRGIKIMQALVDDVAFDAAPGRGTIVYLQKRLTWRDEALLRRLEYDLVQSGS